MREYLFRGKRIDNNEWVYGYLVKGDRIGTTIMTGNYHVNSGSDAFENYEVIPETVGQIVGLKDKQNNNVFGDDILKFYYWSTYEQRSFPEYVDFRETDMKEACGIVYWNDSELSWYVKPISATVYNGSERLVPLEDTPLIYTGITIESISEWVGEDDINKYIGCVGIEIIGNKHSNSELLQSL